MENSYLLHIKEKEEKYIRFILSSENGAVFLEKYVDYTYWKDFEIELLSIHEEINKNIRNHLSPVKEMKILKNTIKDFFKSLFENLSFDRLKVIWDANLFLPIEVCEEINVVNYLRLKRKNLSERAKNIVLIYSESLSYSREEIFSISKLVREKFYGFSVECFSDKDFESYRTNISCSEILHFSSHGRINEKEGEILINDRWVKDLNLEVGFVFLNSCNIGGYTGGLISNLIGNGVKYLVASPFEIYDKIQWHRKNIFGFYESLDTTNIEESISRIMKENEEFKVFFRLFQSSF